MACLAGTAGGAAAPASAAAELPLGPRSLDERRVQVEVAPGVSWTRIVRGGGPWRVNVLALTPGVRVAAVPAGVVGSRARPSSMARRLQAVAAVNGGYFAGDGNPVGALASGGRLLSEPVGGRSALLLGAGSAASRVAGLRFAGSVSVGGEERLLDGVNRVPGVVPACGGRGGDRPTERPDAATTCTDPGELVLFTPEWGRRTPSGSAVALRSRVAAPGGSPFARRARLAGPRVDAVLRGGAVTAIRSRGGTAIPPDGAVLAGTGDGARLLRRAALPGGGARVDLGLRSGRSAVAPVELVGGGPRLVARGRISVRSSAEGFDPLSAPGFFGSFVAARHPRTLAGVRADGGLLLVTVDGRAPGWSVGVTLSEAARLMRSLGAREALNLDGGGSTAMTVRGRTVSRPSDRGGERAVSDALVVLP